MRTVVVSFLLLACAPAFARLNLPNQFVCSFPDEFKVVVKPKVDTGAREPKSVEVIILKDGRRFQHYPNLDIVPRSNTEVDFNHRNTGRNQSLISVVLNRTNNRGEFYADFWPRISTGWCTVAQ